MGLGSEEGGAEDCTLEGTSGGGRSIRGPGSGRQRWIRMRMSGRSGSSMGCIRVSESGSVGGTGKAVWTPGPLVGIERPWRISAAGSSGKSVKSINPVGRAAG